MPAKDGTGPAGGGGRRRGGRGGGPAGGRDGSGSKPAPPAHCSCPGCGAQVPKQIGRRCRDMVCAQCGSAMVGS